METEKRGKVEITETMFTYTVGIGYQYAYFKSKSFEIPINNIKIIGVYYTMIVDDDANILVFVDTMNKKYFIPTDFDLSESSCSSILDVFSLKEAAFSPDYEYYDKGVSKVLYPKSLQQRSLYRKKSFIESFIWGVFKIFQVKYIGDGILTEEIKAFIKS